MAELLSEYKIGYAETSPITWTRIPDLRMCEFPTVETEAVETTAFGDDYASSRPGLRRLNVLRFRAKADPAATWNKKLREFMVNQKLVFWRVEIATNDARTQWLGVEFQGRVGSANYVGNEPGRLLELEVTVMLVPPLTEDAQPGQSEL